MVVRAEKAAAEQDWLASLEEQDCYWALKMQQD